MLSRSFYRIVFFQKLHRAYQYVPDQTHHVSRIMEAAEHITSLTEQALTRFQPELFPMIW